MNTMNRFFRTPDNSKSAGMRIFLAKSTDREDFGTKMLIFLGGGAASDINFSIEKNNFRSGFSLIELIVVIGIMAVLIVVLAPALLQYNERSRAEKDNSTMDEVVNVIQLALADPDVYDEIVRFSTVDNISCYVDTNSEANYQRVVTKANPEGVDQYTFLSDARQLDETPYFAAGNMRGVTITFAPNKGSNGSIYDLKQGVVNQYVQVSDNQRVGAMPELYNQIRSVVGDEIFNNSQTYRNSEYTIFIRLGTTGGNDASKQDSIQAYGQWSGTNLPAAVSYQLVQDRTVGDTGNTITDINDRAWNATNGNKLTLKPGDLNGGGTFSPNTITGNQTDHLTDLELEDGLYDKHGNKLCSWEESGIDISKNYNVTTTDPNYCQTCNTSAYYVLNKNYRETTKIILPDGLKSIGAHSFSYCKNLTTIVMPNSVENISNYAFWQCRGLSSIVIPENVSNIGQAVLEGCESLRLVTVDNKNIYYNDGNNSNCIIETSTNKLIAGCKTTTIPDNIESIGYAGMSECIDDVEIVLPNNLTFIEGWALANNRNLNNIIIPANVTNIGPEIFSRNSSLISITVDDNNLYYNDGNGSNCIIKTATNALIAGCQTTVIPNNVTSIGFGAFHDITTLTSINLSNNIKTIEGTAFFGCTGLTSIIIPDDIKNIQQKAFYNCTKLTSITYKGVTYFGSCGNWDDLESSLIANGVILGNQVFD